MSLGFYSYRPMTNEMCDLHNVPHGSVTDGRQNIYIKTDIKLKKTKRASRFDNLKAMGKISDELRDFLELTENIVDVNVITDGIYKYLDERDLCIAECDDNPNDNLYETDEKIRKFFEIDGSEAFRFYSLEQLPEKHYECVFTINDKKSLGFALARISNELCDLLKLPHGSNGCIVELDVVTEGIYKYLDDNNLECVTAGVHDADEKIRKIFEIEESKPLYFMTFNEVPEKHLTYL